MVRVLSLEVVPLVPRGGREPPGWGSPWLGEVDLTGGGSVVGGKDAGHELQVSLWRAEVPLHGCEVGGWHCLRLELVHVLGGQLSSRSMRGCMNALASVVLAARWIVAGCAV